MRKSALILTLSIGILAVTSCKNGKSTMRLAKEATQEMFDEYKTELADSVLEMVDSIAQEYIDNIQDGSLALGSILTERERLIRPKYLFNPADVEGLITRHQKTAALAFLISERPLRIAYDMPIDDVDAAIVKLLSDLNYPLDMDNMKELSISDNTREIYRMCKEKHQVQSFWEVQTDALINVSYMIASNPDIYYKRLTDEQIVKHEKVLENMIGVLEEIARFDKEMVKVLNTFQNNGVGPFVKGRHDYELTSESFIQFHVENSEKMIDRRNRLLK